MASKQIIDVEGLLQPISDEAPAGAPIEDNPQASALVYAIESERASARGAERSSIHDGDNTEATKHWQSVLDLAPQILQEHSKHLKVASWYSEALIRFHGFAGLHDALRLIQGLLENFWEGLQPLPDPEDGDEAIPERVRCIGDLSGDNADGVLLTPIRKVGLTQGIEPGPFSLWQYHQALSAHNVIDEDDRQSKINALGFSLEDIDESVTESSEEFFVDLRDDLTACIDAFKEIDKKLDELCGLGLAPSTRSVIQLLEECLGVVNHIGKLKFPIEDAEEDQEETSEQSESSGGEKKVVVKKGIMNRDDAFKQLIEISQFFLKTEPHSPVSYMLQKTVKWGNLPLSELIDELVPETSAREHYSLLTGVELTKDDDDQY